MRIDTQWIAYDEDRGIMTRQDSAESVITWLEQFTGGTVQRERRHYDCEIYQYFVGPDDDDWDIYLVFPPGKTWTPTGSTSAMQTLVMAAGPRTNAGTPGRSMKRESSTPVSPLSRPGATKFCNGASSLRAFV